MTLSKEYYSIYLLILIIIGIFTLYRGYKKGIVFQILDIAASIGIMVYTTTICTGLANEYPIYKDSKLLMEIVNPILWFIICYLLLRMVYYFIEFILRKIFKNKTIKFLDHFMGMIVGILKVVIIYGIICLLCMTPLVENGTDFIESTPLVYIEQVIKGKDA